MSSYGPPGGSYPGEQPWPERRPSSDEQPWVDRPRSDPWGDQAAWDQSRPQPDRIPAPPVPTGLPATDKNQTVLLVVVAALALLLGVGGFTAFLLSGGSGGQARPGSSPTPDASTAAAATAAATAAAATPVPTGEFRSIKVGQCMINDGTDEDPRPRLVACAPGTYQVLERFDGTVDYAKNCGTVSGYQFHFFYDSNLDSLDFVLCMRKQ